MFIKNGDAHPITIVDPKSNDRIIMDDKTTKKKLNKVLSEVGEKETVIVSKTEKDLGNK